MFALLKIIGSALMILVLGGGLYVNSQRPMLVEKAITYLEDNAPQVLGVPVKIGDITLGKIDLFKLDEETDVTISGVEIFDKNNDLLARVEEAKVNFKVLALFKDPVAALDVIRLSGVTVNVKKRGDGSWNFNDIKLQGEGKSTFDAQIFLTGGTLNADFDGKNLTLADVAGSADCADMNAIATQISAKTLGAQVTASGTLGKAQQVINAEVDAIFFDKILPFLPADKIPESVTILRGAAEHFTLHALRTNDTLSYLGSTDVTGAAVRVEQTDVEDINGHVTFNEREIIFDATATANGQGAAAGGTVRLDTDEIFLDVHAESDSFTPSAILADIGIDGAARVQAHLVGTVKNPIVDADIYSAWLGYDNLSARNVSTKLHYAGEMIYLNDLRADIFGGTVAGTAEIKTVDLSYNANVKATAVDAATLCDFAGVTALAYGKISADLGINGGGNVPMKVYGSAQTAGLDVKGLHFNDANASFYFDATDLTIDYMSAKIPDGGTLGLEGTIKNVTKGTRKLDLDFYGAHVDLAIARQFNDMVDVSGLADFKGTVRGNGDNPYLTLLLSAVGQGDRLGEHFAGRLFKQPYDSIKLSASGNVDEIHIDDFALEKDGALKWTVIEGTVGLTGNKSVNLKLDTTEVRAEDLAALVAPDQEITGNVSNTVRVMGTLDNLQVMGNITFNRGSYRGMLLSGMTGDYTLEGDILHLENFEITSPMIDIILNGTINKETREMDFVVEGKDIRLERFKAKLPENYTAKGHTKFTGIIKGTPAHPIFDGELKANEIFLNGVALTNVYGDITVDGSDVYLNDFQLKDGDGDYKVKLNFNLDSEAVNGEVNVTNANIAHMFTLADQTNELVDGALNSKILVNGTFAKPRGSLEGEIVRGTFAGSDIHDIKVAVSLIDNVLTVTQLEGKQGDEGTLDLRGKANLGGTLDLSLIAKNIELGLFAKAVGLDLETVGTSNIGAKLTGTVDNPFGEVLVTATGGVKGATFDLLHGHFLFKGQIVDVEELTVEREISGKTYGATVKGSVPLKALTARTKDKLPDNEQMNLKVSLDGADLSLLPVLSNKFISFGVGELKGEVNITGTAAHPQFNGQIALNDGSVKIKYMKSLIEHINLLTVFKGERFDIENLSGNIGSGKLTLTGGFSFPGLEFKDYNFDLVADNLDINSDFYRGLFNANFNLCEGRLFRNTLPKLTGEINLDKCRISVPTLPDDDSPLPEFIMDVAINLGEKVHLYSPRLYDMYLTGNARFEGTPNHPKTSGSISVKRGGTLTYIESVFNIRDGEAHFIGEFFPTINFYAETKVASTKVFLTVGGTLKNRVLKLGSVPEMNETEIIQLLTLRDAYSKGNEVSLTTEDALAISLQMMILGDIEEALKRTLGIDQFTLSRGSGSMLESHTPAAQNSNDRAKDYNIKIGKYINDNLMIRYTRGFGNHHVNRYGLQYDFNDNFGLTLEREGKDYNFSFEARYKF